MNSDVMLGFVIGLMLGLFIISLVSSCVSADQDILMREMKTEAVKRNVASYVIDPSDNKLVFQWHPTTNTLPAINSR